MANLFENADYYDELHKIAVQQIPPEAQNLGQDEFGVAILNHSKNGQSLKDVEASDFLWFKVKGSEFIQSVEGAMLIINRTLSFEGGRRLRQKVQHSSGLEVC
jgi:hypothetical protein